MSELRIYKDTEPGKPEKTLHSFESMREALGEVGVELERWTASKQLDAQATQDEVIEAYRGPIDRLMKKYGFKSVDVISMQPDNPKKAEMRDKFLHEHVHEDFEVRFFVDGDLERAKKLLVERAHAEARERAASDARDLFDLLLVELAARGEGECRLKHERELVAFLANPRETLLHLRRARDRLLDALLEVLNETPELVLAFLQLTISVGHQSFDIIADGLRAPQHGRGDVREAGNSVRLPRVSIPGCHPCPSFTPRD